MKKTITVIATLVFLSSLGWLGYSNADLLRSTAASYGIGAVTSKSTTVSTVDEVMTPSPAPLGVRISGRSVYISSSKGFGSGAILDSRTVATVDHVVDGQRLVLVDVGRFGRKWAPAVVVGKIKSFPEDIVILQIMSEDRFQRNERFPIGSGIMVPVTIVTPRGVFPWNPGGVIPGDSGSAVLNKDGELIGLVTGFRVEGKLPIVTLFR